MLNSSAPPAAGPRVATSAAGFPVIDEVHAATRLGPYAQVNDSLVVTGSALAGDPTLAWIDGILFPGAVTSARFDRATVVVPDDPRLQPGIRSLRIGHGAMLGEPPTPHVGPKSNTAAFVLVPGITGVAVLSGPPRLRVRGNRLIAPDTECMTLVGEQAVEADDYDPASSSTELIMPCRPVPRRTIWSGSGSTAPSARRREVPVSVAAPPRADPLGLGSSACDCCCAAGCSGCGRAGATTCCAAPASSW